MGNLCSPTKQSCFSRHSFKSYEKLQSPNNSIFEIKVKPLTEEKELKIIEIVRDAKAILIINGASKCGLTD